MSLLTVIVIFVIVKYIRYSVNGKGCSIVGTIYYNLNTLIISIINDDIFFYMDIRFDNWIFYTTLYLHGRI